MNSEIERQLQVLLDKDEIRDVLMRYSRGVDRGEADLIGSCYHPDAVDDHGGIEVAGTETGRLFSGGRPLSSTGQTGQHFMGNISIDVQGDTAYTEAYFVSYLVVVRDGVDYTRFRGARYLDRFERRDGAWKIAYRVVVDDWDRLDRVVELAPMREQWRRGNVRELDPAATFRRGPIANNEAAIRNRLRVPTTS